MKLRKRPLAGVAAITPSKPIYLKGIINSFADIVSGYLNFLTAPKNVASRIE
jgi:hypothetical protein